MCDIATASDLIEYEQPTPDHCQVMMWAVNCGEYNQPITPSFVREIHAALFICGGDWRSSYAQISGSNTKLAHPDHIATGIKQFCDLVEWQVQEGHDPLYILANTHLHFAKIHPFTDGNGRVARVVLNYLAARLNFPLIKLVVERKDEYISALEYNDVTGLETIFYESRI